jgi:pimeloyl-ACP methyl ester carboxylesterase
MEYCIKVARTLLHGQKIRYVLKGASVPKPDAIIIFLHGFGEGGSVEKAVKYGPMQPTAAPCPRNITIVTPICRRFYWWRADSLWRFIKEIVDDHSVSLHRICLVGMSMGGYVIWKMLANRPNMLGAAVIVSGSPTRILSSFGVFHATHIDWSTLIQIETPVYSIHGKYDFVASVHDTIRIHSHLQNPDSRVTLYSKMGHTGTMRVAFCDPMVFKWILKQMP